MSGNLRQARRDDVAAMQRVRMSVRENRLVSTTFGDEAYLEAIEISGRGWVVEADGTVVAFAVADARDGSIWALFVDPAHEGQGYGRRLHDVMVSWLRDEGFERLWLTTETGTRAERFYLRAGWQSAGSAAPGEVRLELAVSATRHTGS